MSSVRNKHVAKPIEIQGAKEDAKLNALLEMTKRATETFLDALPNMEDRMSFKAFTIKKFADDESGEKMDAFVDVVQSSIVMHIGQIDVDVVKRYDFDMSVERGDEEVVMWLHARHKADAEEEEQMESEEHADEHSTVACDESHSDHED